MASPQELRPILDMLRLIKLDGKSHWQPAPLDGEGDGEGDGDAENSQIGEVISMGALEDFFKKRARISLAEMMADEAGTEEEVTPTPKKRKVTNTLYQPWNLSLNEMICPNVERCIPTTNC